MTEEDDGFLGRWSRLKRARATPEPEPEPQAEPVVEPPPEPATLSEEDLAALPRLEDLTEGSDIRGFLRAGVPKDMRNAALRRIWMLTPAIRDYSDPAVDYAWDWNTPGGVPGDGVAPSPERAAEMLRDLVTPRDRVIAASAREGMDPEEPATEDAPEPPQEVAAGAPPAEDPAGEEGGDTLAQPQPEQGAPRRRHGSALPG